jgi:site-specific DNA-methyltransferase (adenine-specific)
MSGLGTENHWGLFRRPVIRRNPLLASLLVSSLFHSPSCILVFLAALPRHAPSKVLKRDELEPGRFFDLNWIMPVKLKETPPQMELEVRHQNGTTYLVDLAGGLQLHYEHPNGRLYLGDSIAWLKRLPPSSVDLVFADPPYNLKKADWDDFESHEHYVAWSCEWLKEASRVLKRSGTLYVCGFSEILADVKVAAMPFFKGCRWIVWHYKNKANLGGDWGRSHESIVHFRKSKDFTFNMDDVRIPYGAHTLKYRSHPQAETSQYGKTGNGRERENWIPNPKGAKPKDVMDIPTTCNGMGEKTPIQRRNRRNCSASWCWHRPIPAKSCWIHFPARAERLSSLNNLAGDGWGATQTRNITNGP